MTKLFPQTRLTVLLLLTSMNWFSHSVHAMNDPSFYANEHDKALKDVFIKREQDWRNGAIVYQVLVDRFAPAADLEAKKQHYATPKILRSWDETPARGHYLEKEKLWSHEIEFWGGDLDSVASKLDYIAELGADVLYISPIHLGYTNHKYDALDYQAVSPEFGTREDVKELAKAVHAKQMKIVLDGVFNHMGRNSQAFQEASSDINSPYRDWFYFGDEYPHGHRAWAGAANLPEINLENKAVRKHIYADSDSVVQSYLSDGVDGWRLDVAFDMGFRHLSELTAAAHKRKPGSLVVGEIWNYPSEWRSALDGVMNFASRHVILSMCEGRIDPSTAMQMLERIIDESGIEFMLQSWLLLDNHDTPRLKHMLPQQWQQRMAQVLQFTLPGSPNIYYGTELGMDGGGDPEQRAPMRWDLLREDNQTLAWTRKLIELRRTHRALKVGNFRKVNSHRLIAYERYTDRIADTVIVVANPHPEAITEMMMVANAKLMNNTTISDRLGTVTESIPVHAALITVTLPAGGVAVFTPDMAPIEGYSSFKRVQ